MSRYMVKWKMNTSMFPADPEKRIQLLMSLFQMVKEDEKVGICQNWAMYPESTKGFSFSSLNEEDLAAVVMKYSPYISFKIKPVLSLEQSMRAFQKAVEAGKK